MLRLESELNSFLGWELRCLVAGRQPLAAWLSCTESSCWLRCTMFTDACTKCSFTILGRELRCMAAGRQSLAAWEHLSVFAQTVSLTSHTWMNPNLEPLIYISSPQWSTPYGPFWKIYGLIYGSLWMNPSSESLPIWPFLERIRFDICLSHLSHQNEPPILHLNPSSASTHQEWLF